MVRRRVAYLPGYCLAVAFHRTTKHSVCIQLPFILNPPGARRMVYCRAVRLTETLCCSDGVIKHHVDLIVNTVWINYVDFIPSC